MSTTSQADFVLDGRRRLASPNERRCITRQDIGHQRRLVVGAVYASETHNEAFSLEHGKQPFFAVLKSCIDDHPLLSTVILNADTERPEFATPTTLDLDAHLEIRSAADLPEDKWIEKLLAQTSDEKFESLHTTPPWKVILYKQHAEEVGMPLPSVPTVFMKPNTALGDPWPAATIIPKITQVDDCGDYESELAVVIGRKAKNVSESEAVNYVLGYTAANDVSSRTSQLNQSQWSFSKGFDGSCPLGPTLVSTSLIPDPSALRIRGSKNGKVLQDCPLDDLIFGIPKLVSFLSQSTTLPAGTVIITGTPAGVGMGKKPKETLKAGDEFSVEVSPHIGTLVNVFENEK